MRDESYISFKEMCETFGVTPRTLRYYEYIELLSPLREGRARWYSPREIARMKLIMRGRRFGFSLEEIRQWLLMYQQDGTRAQYEVWIEFATKQLDVLAAQRDDIDAAIADLRKLRDETVALVAKLPPAEDAPPGNGTDNGAGDGTD